MLQVSVPQPMGYDPLVGHSKDFEWATVLGQKYVRIHLSRQLITTTWRNICLCLAARFSLNCFREWIRYFRIMRVCLCA